MKYFLSFDVGTTSMKCILFDKNFKEVYFCEKEYALLTPEEDWVELEPKVYYNTLCDCIGEMIENGVDVKLISTLTITTQGETFIPVDKSGNALMNAIVWLDNRASSEAEYIKSKISMDEIYETTGLGEINGAVPAAKLLWIYKNRKDIYDKTYKFMLLEDYLVYKLTGRAVTEQSIASSTAWFDINNECYYAKMLDVCSIDEEKLPELVACGEVIGKISEVASEETGLNEETLVVSGAMDQISSAIGAGNIKSGIVTETTGTALVVGATVDKPVFDNESRITIYKHFNHNFMYMPYCNTAGIVLKWFRDELMKQLKAEAKANGKSVYAAVDELAEQSVPGSGGVITLPHFAGKDGCERAKGVVYGLTLGTHLCDIARSVLESVGCMLNELLIGIEKTGINISEIRSLGGGAKSKIWCEIKAGITNKKILSTNYAQTTALGAAMLGSVAIGEYKTVEDAINAADIGYKSVEPKADDLAAYEEVYNKYSELYEALNKIF